MLPDLRSRVAEALGPDREQYLFGMPVVISSTLPPGTMMLVQRYWEGGRERIHVTGVINLAALSPAPEPQAEEQR
jgi:hypothetical protein